MLHYNNQIIRGAAYSDFLIKCICAALLLIIFSCSSDLTIRNETLLSKESEYSLIFIIHGDGNYLYHDTNGNEYYADQVTLEKAKRIAEKNLNAEVFIFYQKPKRHFLLFFPQKDGEYYYYRNGQLAANETYWRDQEESNFEFEAGIYNNFNVGNQQEKINMFLYFGHEIPELGGVGYDESYPDRAFTIKHLARGLNSLTGDSTRFDLMLLSTCFGGTPYTISTLGPYAKYIIASPENLHLSYFEINFLERLEFNLHDSDIHTFAKKFAQQAFERLTSEIQTAVSIAVYDIDRVHEYSQSIYSIYENTLTTLRGESQFYPAAVERCDCADIDEYVLPMINDGVDVLYRAARFGRSKHKENHSGWQCWRKNE
jgi:hypothetical protein